MTKVSNYLESIVFVAGKEIAIDDVREKLGITKKEMDEAIAELKEKYSGECGINLLLFHGKIQFSSNPAYVEQVSEVLNPIREKELTKAMLETLAIIAYKQPITRLEVEEIRGVDCTYAVQNLSKLSMIKIVGRKDAIGKPLLFGTTDEFLKRFQISSLDDLPDYDELMSRIRAVNGTADTDSYLFKKDEYIEGQERPTTVDITDVKTRGEAESELGDISEEEIPDFLDGEEYTVFSGDDYDSSADDAVTGEDDKQ